MAAKFASSVRDPNQRQPRSITAEAQTLNSYPWLGICVIVLTTIPFFQGIFFDFVTFDDPLYVIENSLTVAGFSFDSLRRVIFEYHVGNWHPATMLTFMIEYSFLGPMPGVYHLTNIALHAGTVYVLYSWLRETTGAPIRSVLVALLFGLHPLRVESVTWISERKDVLCGLFWMLTLLTYSRYSLDQTVTNYRRVCFYAAICFLSKPMAVTLPCVMLLLDFWPLRRWQPRFPTFFPQSTDSETPSSATPSGTIQMGNSPIKTLPLWRLVREKSILFAMASFVGVVTINAQSDTILTVNSFPLWERIRTPLIGMALYLRKMVIPIDLAPYYPQPIAGWSWLFTGACGSLVLIASGVAIFQMQRRPHLFVGWFWFVGVLFPVCGVLQTGEQLIADRYSYLPSIGILIAVIWSLPQPLTRLNQSVCRIACALIVAMLGFLTVKQVSHWRGSISLFEHTLSVTKDNVWAHNALAAAFTSQQKYREAREQYQLSLNIDPNNIAALLGLSAVEEHQGQIQSAVTACQRAAAIDKSTPKSVIALAGLYHRIGDRGAVTKTLREIATNYPRPHTAQAYNDLGSLYYVTSQQDLALESFRSAVSIDPNFSLALNNMGSLLANQGDFAAAIPCFESALRAAPGSFMTHYCLAKAYSEAGNVAKAIENLKACLTVAPDYVPAKQLYQSLKKQSGSPEINGN